MATSRNITSETERELLVKFIQSQPTPFHATVADGRKRSLDQNALQQKWVSEIAEQRGDESAEYYRGFCKAMFGVPIRCRDDEAFKAAYDRDIRPLPYDTKIRLMMKPYDMAVTRDMTVKQQTEYLDEMFRYWSEHGVILTQPEQNT